MRQDLLYLLEVLPQPPAQPTGRSKPFLPRCRQMSDLSSGVKSASLGASQLDSFLRELLELLAHPFDQFPVQDRPSPRRISEFHGRRRLLPQAHRRTSYSGHFLSKRPSCRPSSSFTAPLRPTPSPSRALSQTCDIAEPALCSASHRRPSSGQPRADPTPPARAHDKGDRFPTWLQPLLCPASACGELAGGSRRAPVRAPLRAPFSVV